LATLAIFYFDFRDSDKQDARRLLSSILIQLCDQSDNFSEILFTLFANHGRGSRQPREAALLEYLKRMLKLPGQGTLYLVLDGLDECPDSSGRPTSREQVLAIVQGLIDLQLPHLHLCVTSRPEIDIRDVLEPLAVHNVPLHEQDGQRQDIIDYIHDFIQSDTRVQRWRDEDKQLVIETLTKRASGMCAMTSMFSFRSLDYPEGSAGCIVRLKRSVSVFHRASDVF
jgi:NACHT domain